MSIVTRLIAVLAVLFAAALVSSSAALAQDATTTGSEETPAPETTPTPAQPAMTAAEKKRLARKVAYLRKKIKQIRKAAWYWQVTAFRPKTPTGRGELRTKSIAYLRWIKRLWKKKRNKAYRYATNPPRLSAWLCIHRHEGAWNANTGNGYYGGLQMDLSFQRTYGARLLRKKGTANRWTPIEQIWVAEQAYRSGRGFTPWPNTARYCGLL